MGNNIQDIYPLSPMQKGMLFHTIYSPDSEVYKEQLCCKLIGDINIEVFKQSWLQIINRHDILRTAFVWEELDEPLQVVKQRVDLPFEYLDISEENEIDLLNFINDEKLKSLKKVLDFAKAPLIRLKLIKLKNSEYFFILNHHHILFDGWGFPILFNELLSIYNALINNNLPKLAETFSFKNYIAWILNQDLEKSKSFWQKYLENFNNSTILKLVYNNKSNDYYDLKFSFSSELTEEINYFIKNEKITLNTFLQAVWGLLLSYYLQRDDVLFGATVSGRNANVPGIENMVGLFINTLPVRVNTKSEKSVSEWLKEFQEINSKFQLYEFTPLFDIHSWSEIPNDQEMFNTLLIFQNYPIGDQLNQGASKLQIKDVQTFEKTNYPLTFVISPGQNLSFEIAFLTEFFTNQHIVEIFNRFKVISENLIRISDKNISDLKFINEHESKLIIEKLSLGKSRVNKFSNIVDWFDDIVSQYPENIAVEHNSNELTFSELNDEANKLSNLLLSSGIKSEDVVLISLEKSIDMIVSILGVIKIGACYLPIDPDYPDERIKYILNDSNAKLIITSSKNQKSVFNNYKKIIIDDPGLASSTPIIFNHHVHIDPQNSVYVIYTSGSTGKPKGVMLNHKGLVNTIQNMIEDFEISSTDKILQFSSLNFDGSVAEIFLSLLVGCKLILIDRSLALSIEDFSDFIKTKGISFATLPPSYLSLLNPENFKNNTKIISVGDKCTLDIAKKWKDNVKFFNGYGPTETTIASCWNEVSEIHKNYQTIPVGNPLANIEVYILDKNLYPLTNNIVGELYIGGDSLGRGYLNKPDLTAEKFIPNPFSNEPGRRIFKTGDLGIFTSEGKIEIIGRKDFQVKIRGNRIELSEIENIILQNPLINDCIVTAIKEKAGNETLAAYLIPKDNNLKVSAIQNFLSKSLPQFMVPAHFIVLDKFPVNSSGKIDRNNLPQPTANIVDDNLREGFNINEDIIKNIWSFILRTDSINRDSNFFHLGGHSLLATQLLSRLRETFQKNIPLQLIFSNPVLKDLAIAVEKFESKYEFNKIQIEKIDRNQAIPLSYSQQRLWFLDKLQPNQYNIPSVLRIEGNLDFEKFTEAVNFLIKKHEILRTVFIEIDGQPIQKILDKLNINIPINDISSHEEITKKFELDEFVNNDIYRPFKLNTAPLFRMRIVKTSNNNYVLVLVVHHIISDGWSMNIIIEEFFELYNTIINSKTITVTQPEYQFADYSVWQKKMMESDLFIHQIEYWKEQLKDIPAILSLPLDKQRPSIQSSNGKNVEFEIETEITQALKQICKNENSTLFMILLTAFNILLYKYSHQNDIIVGTPIAGREIKEFENTIGFFVNNLSIRTKISGFQSVRSLLQSVRKTTLDAYSNQSVPFDKLVEELKPERDLSHQPIFQVMFVFQNLLFNEKNSGNIKIVQEHFKRNSTAFDLSITMQEVNVQILGAFEYNTDLFFESSIKRLIENYRTILKSIISKIEEPICELEMLTSNEKEIILKAWNENVNKYEIDELVHERFEKAVKVNANSPALIFASNSIENSIGLTYHELNNKSNQLANYLIKLNPECDKIVAVCMDRSIEMIITILAILKSGKAFLPIDPSLPVQRIQYMADDSKCLFMIIHKKYQDQLCKVEKHKLIYEEIEKELKEFSPENLNIKIDLQNLAYVIYTSGSTGNPKGVMLGHAGLTNLSIFQREAFNINHRSKIFQFSSISFDAAVWEIVMALTNGATLYLTSKETILSGFELIKYLNNMEISTITLPPSVLAVIPEKSLPKLETLITAGEAIPNALMQKWCNDKHYFNAYGPTETTVCATLFNFDKKNYQVPPIGKVINNLKAYILDANLRPVGIGIPGELCIGGVGLARGYLNNPSLTAEKFIPDFYSNKTGERLYKTGDLVKFLEDGNIEFLGRIDSQVKLRGFRIETSEVENCIKQIEPIIDSVVTTYEISNNNLLLVAYFVSNESIESEYLKTILREELPEYMIPNLFVQIDKIPLTISGKVNKKLLPKPEFHREMTGKEFIEPKTETQKILADIISSLLELKKVGINDNFFELGGHSLLATQFISRINKSFEIELQLTEIFKAPTVEKLAEIIDKIILKGNQQNIKSIQKISREDRRIKKSEL